MHPIGHTSLASLYSFSSRITSGALYIAAYPGIIPCILFVLNGAYFYDFIPPNYFLGSGAGCIISFQLLEVLEALSISSTILANLKSQILAVQSSLINIFAGFKSLCKT